MDMGTRGMFTKTTIASLEALKISQSDKEALFCGYVSSPPVERGKRRPTVILDECNKRGMFEAHFDKPFARVCHLLALLPHHQERAAHARGALCLYGKISSTYRPHPRRR